MIFHVPETKGRTLEEMDEIFGSTGIAAEDSVRKARIEREIGLLALLGEDSENSEEEKAQNGIEQKEDIVDPKTA